MNKINLKKYKIIYILCPKIDPCNSIRYPILLNMSILGSKECGSKLQKLYAPGLTPTSMSLG
jgi:hypothetical protein